MLAILQEQHFVGHTQDHLVLLLAHPCMLIPWSFFKIVLIWTMVKHYSLVGCCSGCSLESAIQYSCRSLLIIVQPTDLTVDTVDGFHHKNCVFKLYHEALQARCPLLRIQIRKGNPLLVIASVDHHAASNMLAAMVSWGAKMPHLYIELPKGLVLVSSFRQHRRPFSVTSHYTTACISI